MKENNFHIKMAVRSYECDFQGIVNNAVYMNYLEHARMCFGESAGISVVQMAEDGIIWVVSGANLRYRSSLRAGDLFEISTSMNFQGRMRAIFEQQITKANSGEVVMEAEIITACIIGGRTAPFPEFLRKE
ncbi:MAG: acyl-CoA thioesterase [Spirochaetia bacterium]